MPKSICLFEVISVLAIGDMVVKIHAFQTLAVYGGEWLASQSSSSTLHRLRLCIRRVRS